MLIDAKDGRIPDVPTRYALTAEDLISPLVGDPVPYREGDYVSRQNLTPFLVHSFAVSRGYKNAHELYFNWKQDNEGFMYRETLAEYLKAGGKRLLTEAEIELIASAVRRIDIHKTYDVDLTKLHADGIATYFNGQISLLVENVGFRGSSIVHRDTLKGMSFRELQDAIGLSLRKED